MREHSSAWALPCGVPSPRPTASRRPASAAGVVRLLAADVRAGTVGDLATWVTTDRARRGAVATRAPGGALRRAEPGPCGPLVLEARPDPRGVALAVWGPAATPAHVAERALADAGAWAGLGERAGGFADLVAAHPVLRALQRRLGTPRLSRVPRLGEAFGRAVLGQLVQSLEARRSTAQVAVMAGEEAAGGLWCWPTAARIGATPAWALRRCGVSLRGARALHAAAVADQRLAEGVGDWPALDARLRALSGVGVWTSAETRLALGDPDAVSVGDYHLPALIGTVLGGGPVDAPRASWTDAGMLALLAPYAGQRGRVIRLVVAGVAAGLVARPARRAPRAALSAHRYW